MPTFTVLQTTILVKSLGTLANKWSTLTTTSPPLKNNDVDPSELKPDVPACIRGYQSTGRWSLCETE